MGRIRWRSVILVLAIIASDVLSEQDEDYDEEPIEIVLPPPNPEGIVIFDPDDPVGQFETSSAIPVTPPSTLELTTTADLSTISTNYYDVDQDQQSTDQEPRCRSAGQVFPYSEQIRDSCFKFRFCKRAKDQNLQLVDIECPTNAQWIPGTSHCGPISEQCRIQRMSSFDLMPSWLQFELQCPPTASLTTREQSKFHRYSYYQAALNKSRENRLEQHKDYFTPIVLQRGIYRHERFRCDAFFKCEYRPQGTIHVFRRARLSWCKPGHIFNQDWHYCMSQGGLDAGYKQTHPVAETKSECVYYL